MKNNNIVKKKELLFSDANGEHCYRLDGVIIPSVNEILNSVYQNGYCDFVAMERGKYLHRRFEELIVGLLNLPWIKNNAAWSVPYIEQFGEYYDKCLTKEGNGHFGCEVMSYADAGYAGTVDLVVYKDEGKKIPQLIVDYKTCIAVPGKAIRKKHAEQVSAYVNMMDNSWNTPAQVVYIMPNSFKVFRYDYTDVQVNYYNFYNYLTTYKERLNSQEVK